MSRGAALSRICSDTLQMLLTPPKTGDCSCRRNGEPYPIHECPIFCHQQRGTTAKNESEIFVHKDGHHYDIVYSVSAVGDYASGGSVIEFRDVTEEKRLDQERMNAILVNEQQSIRTKESEAHKANLDSFVSFVCHELRNQLQGATTSSSRASRQTLPGR
ncbi:hypothetical protein BJ546DRAFT_113803 [Cryomyces antarcticus]